jgi:hypothetical protein
MIDWFINNPVVSGLITVLLMWSDWFLTIAQERERQNHYFEHYQSYPINTIEGNPAFQKVILNKKIINPKHISGALIIGVGVGYAMTKIPHNWCDLFLGYIWGIFLIVIMQHLSNLIGYIASRKGVHGKLWIHQRTSYAVQSGRYFSISIFLLVISFLTSSHLIFGVTIAGFSSAIRQIRWMRKVPIIGQNDDQEYDK